MRIPESIPERDSDRRTLPEFVSSGMGDRAQMTTIVIPMAGRSQRFFDAGYKTPKYMLPIGGRSMFAHAVRSFEPYFDEARFVFVARAPWGTAAFLRKEIATLGIVRHAVVMLEEETDGQAETVLPGVDGAAVGDDEALTIFNVDNFRPGFLYPDDPTIAGSDGLLETFSAPGDRWSFVLPARDVPGAAADTPQTLVARTTEKQRISDLCSTGLYHFGRTGDFREACAASTRLDTEGAPGDRERHVAPLYNHLISLGRRVHYTHVEAQTVIECGTPEAYEALAASNTRP